MFDIRCLFGWSVFMQEKKENGIMTLSLPLYLTVQILFFLSQKEEEEGGREGRGKIG